MSSPMFDVTAASTQPLTLEKSRRAKFTFTVTSRSDMTVRAILQAVPLTNQDLPRGSTETLGALDAAWLKPATEAAETSGASPGPLVASFRPKETRQVAVDVAVPPSAPPGQYRFRLVAALENDPVATSCPSPPVTFQVAGEPVAPVRRGLLFAILAGVLVLAIGITLFLVLRDSDDAMIEVPNVVGLEFQIAVTKLVVKDLTPVNAKSTISDQAEGTVLSQTPEAGTRVAKDELVELEVAGPAVEVPPLVGKLMSEVEPLLVGLKLSFQVGGQRVTGQPVGTVLTQDPPAGQRVPLDAVVHLEIESSGVTVPGVKGDSLVNAMIKLQRANLQIGNIAKKFDRSQLGDTIAEQHPDANARAAAGDRVDLTVWTTQNTKLPIKFTTADLDRLRKAGLSKTGAKVQLGHKR